MKSETSQTINEIREKYLNVNLDSEPDDPPSLKDLAEEHGVNEKLVLRAASSQNWYARRRMLKDRFLNIRDDEFEKSLALTATNRAQVMVDIVVANLAHINTHLPQVIARLSNALPTMDTPELLAYLKLLQTMSKDILKLSQESASMGALQNTGARQATAMEDLAAHIKSLADLSDRVKGATIIDVQMEEERSMALAALNNEKIKEG